MIRLVTEKGHQCDAICRAILAEKQSGHPCPPTWNSLDWRDQQLWASLEHRGALAAAFNEQRGRLTKRVVAFFRSLFTRRQYETHLANANPDICPTCNRVLR